MNAESPHRRSPGGGPIVLVGLMGAGKSTVGRLVAGLCGRRFLDLDEEIVRRTGRTVPELFAESGEVGFREIEARVTRDIAARAPEAAELVVAAGGGWMFNRAARTALPRATTVWLKVGPAEAARRMGPERADRPLLAGVDPASRLRALLDERLPAYRDATYTVDTAGRTADAVAREVAAVTGLLPETGATHTDS